MTTYPLTKYFAILLLKEYILFIGCWYYLSECFDSCCFFRYHGGINKTTSMPGQYRCSALYYVLYYQHDGKTLDSFVLTIQKGPDLNLPPYSPLFVATPLLRTRGVTTYSLQLFKLRLYSQLLDLLSYIPLLDIPFIIWMYFYLFQDMIDIKEREKQNSLQVA